MDNKNKKSKNFVLTISLVYIFFAFILVGCDDKENGSSRLNDSFRPVPMTPISGTRIMWDYSSLQQIADRGANPKMLRVNEDELVAIYDWNDNVIITRSADNGVTWGNTIQAFGTTTHEGTDTAAVITIDNLMTQPAIARLADGSFVVACAVRYNYSVRVNNITEVFDYPAAIRFRRVTASMALATAETVFANLGAENPAFLQLPDGRLQMYFANGSTVQPIRILNSTDLDLSDLNEQHIAVIESSDGGRSWSSHVREAGPNGIDRNWTGERMVASRANRKNVWPAPIVVNDNIVVGLADNRSLTFKPYTVRSPLADNWRFPVNGDMRDREYALFEILPDIHSMTAPFILRLNNGETLMSYETTEGRKEDCELMEVAIGNTNAFDFRFRTRPFPFDADEFATGNSLMQFDNNTVVALTTSNRGLADDETAPWMVKGFLLSELEIDSPEITDYPILVSARTGSTMRTGLGIDDNNLYVNVRVTDRTPIVADIDDTNGDGVFIYIDAANLSLLAADDGIYKFWISAEGDVVRWNGREGQWVRASAIGTIITPMMMGTGYNLDIIIPRASLNNFNSRGIRFGAAIRDYYTENTSTTEMLSLCLDLRSSTWLGVRFPW